VDGSELINYVSILGTVAKSAVEANSKLAFTLFGSWDAITKDEQRDYVKISEDLLKITGHNGKIQKNILGDNYTIPWKVDDARPVNLVAEIGPADVEVGMKESKPKKSKPDTKQDESEPDTDTNHCKCCSCGIKKKFIRVFLKVFLVLFTLAVIGTSLLFYFCLNEVCFDGCDDVTKKWNENTSQMECP